MSLYNMIGGVSPLASAVLHLLDLDQDDFGRFRDAWFEGDHMIVRTRTGGGNRDDYEATIEELSEHPLFVSEEDDDFDSTYMTFTFDFPEGVLEKLKAELPPEAFTSERSDLKGMFDKALESLKTSRPDAVRKDT